MDGSVNLERVLLVEDQPDDERIVRAYLPDVNIDVVQSVKDARTALGKFDYDVVLTDLHVTDSRGINTVRDIVGASQGVPVIALTAKEPDVGENVMQAGAQDFIAKDDLSEQSLARAIRYGIHRVDRDTRRKQIAAMVSTDLHEPMSLLRGELETLLGTTLTDAQHQSIDMMRRHIERQAAVVDELREYMRS